MFLVWILGFRGSGEWHGHVNFNNTISYKFTSTMFETNRGVLEGTIWKEINSSTPAKMETAFIGIVEILCSTNLTVNFFSSHTSFALQLKNRKDINQTVELKTGENLTVRANDDEVQLYVEGSHTYISATRKSSGSEDVSIIACAFYTFLGASIGFVLYKCAGSLKTFLV